MSQDSRAYSRNLRSSPYASKQARWGDKRVWWFIVLFRGDLHVEFMPDGWEQTAEGMAMFVSRLESILRSRLGPSANLPRVVTSDRGPGFYQSCSGCITGGYSGALAEHGFRALAGEDASGQPADIPDVLLHETVAGWIRTYFKKHPCKVTQDVASNELAMKAMMRDCVSHIRANYDLAGLCAGFRRRLQELVDAKGDRLSHCALGRADYSMV